MVSLTGTLRESLLVQSEHELYLSHLYLCASNWIEVRHYEGFAKKFKSESDEQRESFHKIISYVTLRGDPVEVRAKALQTVEWADVVSVFEYFFALETENYHKLHALFAQARQEADFDVEKKVKELLEQQVQAVDDWEGRVLKAKGYSSTPGLIWLYDRSIE